MPIQGWVSHLSRQSALSCDGTYYRRSKMAAGLFTGLALVPMSCLGTGYARPGGLDLHNRKAKEELLEHALAR